MPIIITVTHAVCFSRTERDCDRRAAVAARMLHDILKAKKCDVVLEISSSYREEVDSNRKDARDTLWRKQLNRTIREQQKLGKVFVLDIHSFPPDMPAMGHLKAYFVELDMPSSLSPGKRYQGWSDADKAWAWLAVKESIGETNSRVVLGDGHNDIMLTSSMTGASTVILEVNESLDILGEPELGNFFIHLTDELFMKYC